MILEYYLGIILFLLCCFYLYKMVVKAKEMPEEKPPRYWLFYGKYKRFTYSEAKAFWENERDKRGCKRTQVEVWDNIENTLIERAACSEYFTQ